MRYQIKIPDQEYFDKNIPCRTACPIHTECGRYVQSIGVSRDEEAYLLSARPIHLLMYLAAFARTRVRTTAGAAR
jgi:NADPH-dependent glutamate synthase beta subunit-like oxidoreductase